jgi:5-methylcytosine-specific restriction enzyme A
MTARSCLDCGGLVSNGSRCRACSRQHKLGWAWSNRRTSWLAAHPECAACGATATEVDHIVPRSRDGGEDGNLQSLCHGCHVAKTTRERRS